MSKIILASHRKNTEAIHREAQQYTCPVCGRRLFDAGPESVGVIEIKCSRCRQVSSITVDTVHLAGTSASGPGNPLHL